MSPASQTGGLRVERYIGSYLVSNSSRANNGGHKPHQAHQAHRALQTHQAHQAHQAHQEYDGSAGKGSPKHPQYLGHGVYRGGYVPADGLFCPPPFCQNRNNWAGVPLISTANHRRNGKPHAPARPPPHSPHSPPYHHQRGQVGGGGCNPEYGGDSQQIPLSKLALHTLGAPLILSRRYNNNGNRKPNQYQNNTRQFPPYGANRAPVVPDMIKKMKDVPKENRYDYKDHPAVSRTPAQSGQLAMHMDSLSVTSDESSGSAHSETCLPRIIKPRKRRKKDRKPLANGALENGMGIDSKHEAGDLTDSTLLTLNPYLSNCLEKPDINHNTSVHKPGLVSSNVLDYMKLYSASGGPNGQIEDGKFMPTKDVTQPSSKTSDTRAIHRVDDADGNESDDSSSLFEAISRCSPTVCQCRYCDPSGQIWDIDQRCRSPLSSTPTELDTLEAKNPFVDKDTLLRRSWSEPCPGYSFESLRISEYDKRSTPHKSEPNIITSNREISEASGNAKSVGVIGAGRRTVKSSESPSTLDWKEDTTVQSRLVPETLFKSSSSHGVSLEVSSAIVTSLNGHRDLEIKFFSTSPAAVVSETASFVYPYSASNPDEYSDSNSKCEMVESRQ